MFSTSSSLILKVRTKKERTKSSPVLFLPFVLTIIGIACLAVEKQQVVHLHPTFSPPFDRILSLFLSKIKIVNAVRIQAWCSIRVPFRCLDRSLMDNRNIDTRIHNRLRLWEYPELYVIEPTDGAIDRFLAISRLDGALSLIEKLPETTTAAPIIRPVFGIAGMLRLYVGSYLLVITETVSVGSYWGHPIYRVSSVQVLPCNLSLKNSSSEQKKMEAQLSAILNVAERTHGLFFSYDVNLTLSAQRLCDISDELKSLPLWRQGDPRFIWNSYLLETLIESKIELERYILPIIQGSYQNFQSDIANNRVDVTLIARRCTRRAGTRMWRRGADSEGYAANFVESEQIVQFNGMTASHVQVRGSIPLLWEQIVDLTYKPGFELVKLDEAPRVVERHFLDLKNRYGSVLAVDLVNKHGSEGRLNAKYANTIQQLIDDDLRYVHFDFHRICGHIHFEKLSLLYNQIEDSLKKQRYLLLDPNGEKIEKQLGVVRTNCVDCLDRTNVTQSMIGRKILETQLRRLGVIRDTEMISAYPEFDSSFKILWANHGDDISIQYSGTPALKGDFVRYGKRTIQGILNDGRNALARYYLNNFADGKRQDSIDLIQGQYIVSISRGVSFQSQGGLQSLASFRLAFGLVLAGMFLAVISMRQAPGDVRNLIFSFVCGGLSLCIAAYMKTNGRMFTDKPCLVKSTH